MLAQTAISAPSMTMIHFTAILSDYQGKIYVKSRFRTCHESCTEPWQKNWNFLYLYSHRGRVRIEVLEGATDHYQCRAKY